MAVVQMRYHFLVYLQVYVCVKCLFEFLGGDVGCCAVTFGA